MEKLYEDPRPWWLRFLHAWGIPIGDPKEGIKEAARKTVEYENEIVLKEVVAERSKGNVHMSHGMIDDGDDDGWFETTKTFPEK